MVVSTYLSQIDGHVHLRGDEYSHIVPSFAALAFRDAKAVGLRALVEEPNPEPFPKDRKSVARRIERINRIRREVDAEDVEYALAVAITGDEQQILESLEIINENPRVPTGKSFFSPTTKSEDLEIVRHDMMRNSWITIANSPLGNIVREQHLEDKDLFILPFDPKNPETHAYRQGAETEVVQFDRNLGFAYDAGFKGIFLVKHTTNPDTIRHGEEFIRKHPEWAGRIMFETTYHHMLLNIEEDYPIHGNGVKMNPPLRLKKMQEELLELVVAGRTHTIGSDHAGHPYGEKIGPPYKSGIPEIPFIPMGVHLLRKAGLKQQDERRLTFDTPNKLYFGGKLEPREVTVEYQPDLWNAYGWNPFSRIDGSLVA